MRGWCVALGIVLGSTQAHAADVAARQAAERELFRQVVEIPTVAGRGEMPRLVKLL